MHTSNKLITGFLLLILLSITTFLISAKIYSSKSFIEESGNLISEYREVNGFHGVDVNSGILLYLQQDDKEQVEIKADKNILPYISTKVEDGVLKIRREGKIRRKNKIEVYVSAIDLHSLKFSSGAKVETLNNFQGADLSVSGSSGSIGKLNLNYHNVNINTSSGTILDLEGKVENISLETSSGSNVKAEALSALNYDVKSSSGSIANINVQNELSASVSSGAHVKYIGDPEVKKASTSSGGSLTN